MISMFMRVPRLSLMLLALLALGCSDSGTQQTAEPMPVVADPVVEDPALSNATVSAWLQAIAILDRASSSAQELARSVEALLAEPDDEHLQAAREAWHQSHSSFLEFELFAALSASNPGLFTELGEFEFGVEAWPIQPGYLDYYDVYTHSGIVNDIAMPLTAEALRQQHGFTDSSDVSLGFHALEYLLWGEAGKRPASDFQASSPDSAQLSAGMREVDLPNNRRRVLLTLLANLLVDDMGEFQTAVENPSGLLRRSYLTLQPHSRLELLQGAATVLLSHHRDLLQAQLDLAAEPEVKLTEVWDSLRHSPYAGGHARQLAQCLTTVELVLLDSEQGLGQWVVEDASQREAALGNLSLLRKELLQLDDQSWPPPAAQTESILARLDQLAAVFDVLAMPGLEVPGDAE